MANMEQGYTQLMESIAGFFHGVAEHKQWWLLGLVVIVGIIILKRTINYWQYRYYLRKIGDLAEYKRRHPALIEKDGEILCFKCHFNRQHRAGLFIRCSRCNQILYHGERKF